MSETEMKHCEVCEGGIEPLAVNELKVRLAKELPKWQYDEKAKRITRKFEFKGFMRTMSFVNAVAWIANFEGHHPDLEVSYSFCVVNYQTHAVDGVTDNDFICAKRIDALLK